MSTIIKRAVDALNAAGHEATALELLNFATGLKDTSLQLLESYRKQHAAMRKIINVMQARCPHHEWYLGTTNDEANPGTWGPEDTIVCYICGHTVCDELAYAFGKRVRQGDYYLYSIANGRRFGLNPGLKKRLSAALKVKELTDADIYVETLQAAGECTGESTTG
jgi:hypothetical protein